MKMPETKKLIDLVEVNRKMMEESISIMRQWGYNAAVTYNAKHYESPWSVHITRVALNEDEEPVSVFFGGGSPGVAIRLAYENVERWERDAHNPPVLPMNRAFADVCNRQSAENGSNTPDWILGNFLSSALCALDAAIASRDQWYGVKLEPGQHRCRAYNWENGERATINVGAIFKIGKRLWRLKGLPGEEQGDDMWHFESTEPESELRGGCPFDRLFTRSELQWLYGHGAFVGQPADTEGAVL